MTDIAELERRVAALEAAHNESVESQRWMAATLGRIAAVQDEHTKRLGKIEATQDQHTKDFAELRGDVTAIKSDLSGLRRDLPGIIAETMREVLKEGK